MTSMGFILALGGKIGPFVGVLGFFCHAYQCMLFILLCFLQCICMFELKDTFTIQ